MNHDRMTERIIVNNSSRAIEGDFWVIGTTERTIQDRLTFGTVLDNHQFADEPTTKINKI